MTSRDFCYWLQGHFEISNPKFLGEKETDMIKRHLALVFKHEIDPSMPDPTGELQSIHDSVKPSAIIPINPPTVITGPARPPFQPPGNGMRC